MNEERAREIAIRIVDEFEELLAQKGIMVPSADREGGEKEACLYGTEYYLLEDAVVGILMKEIGGEAEEEAARDGIPEQARQACEAMRWRMATAPEGFAGKASFPPAKRTWR